METGEPYASICRMLRSMAGYGVIAYRPTEPRSKAPILKCRGIRLYLPFKDTDVQTARWFRCIVDGNKGSTNAACDRHYNSIDDFYALLSDRAWSIMRAIADQKPQTIAEIAASAKNNVDYSYRIIQRLAKEDIVSLHEKGQTKKPSLSYDGIMLELTW